MIADTATRLASSRWAGSRSPVLENLFVGIPTISFHFPFIFQLRRSENCKKAAIPAFFELNCRLPKLRMWVRHRVAFSIIFQLSAVEFSNAAVPAS